jgi:hypothetical protein
MEYPSFRGNAYLVFRQTDLAATDASAALRALGPLNVSRRLASGAAIGARRRKAALKRSIDPRRVRVHFESDT